MVTVAIAAVSPAAVAVEVAGGWRGYDSDGGSGAGRQWNEDGGRGEGEVILCEYCWHQWCHEDGGHTPQHIDAAPDPEWHGPPFITTPKRQRASSEQREGRTKRRRPPSPDAPPVRPRQAARAPSRLQELRKEKAEKKKQKKAQTAKAMWC